MTNWRSYGDCSLATYEAEFRRLNSPMLPFVADVYAAAVPNSRLALAMMCHEQKYATLTSIPTHYHNPLSLAKPKGSPLDGVNRWMRYASWAEGVQAWEDRLTSPSYKDGVYANTVTLADLIRVYAPSSENDTNHYIDTVQNLIEKFTRVEEPPMPMPTTPDRPKPTIYDLSTDYARYGLAQWQAAEIIASRFTNRNGGRPEFIVLHVQDGITNGSLSWWASNAVDASSTVMIQKDGSILKIIPEQHGPWTNGDVSSPTAEAAEILAYGGNPNNWTLSIEREGYPADTLPTAQLDAIIWQVEDWLIRYPHILEHEWAILRHRHINSTGRWRCPDEGSNTESKYFAPVVEAVNQWLEGVGNPFEPPVVVPPDEPGTVEPPASPYPKGMSEELAKRLYGTVTLPWFSGEFVFNVNRSECAYWLARGQRNIPKGGDYTQGEWPELDDVIRRGATKNIHVYRWQNGDVYEKAIRKDQ